MSWLPELAAIAAAPFEDAPRLALAEALERAGEVDRATFIRLQCQKGPATYDQARKLLEASPERAAAWSGLAPALAGMVDTAVHRYSRGLIDTLHFRDPGVFASLDDELKASPATTWQLHAQEPYGYESAGPFPNVRRIELHAMAQLDLERFLTPARFPHLESLVVSARVRWPSLMRCLESGPALQSLTLYNQGDLSIHLADILRVIQGAQLQSLALTCAGLGDVVGTLVTGLSPPRFPVLTALSLSQARIGGDGGKALSTLALPSLRELDLFGNDLGKGGLTGVSRIAGLRALVLGSNRIKSADLSVLAKGESASTLTSLDLRSNRGIDDSVVASLALFPQLSEVLLGRTECSRDVVTKLAVRNVLVPDADALPARATAAEGPASGKADTPEALKHALRYFEPGSILKLVRKGDLGLDLEYDPYSTDEWTGPFHLIAGVGGTREVAALVEKEGREVDERDPSGRTPLMFACMGPLLEPWDGEQPRTGSVKTVERLLSLGAEVNARDDAKRTALHHAAEMGALGCIKALLKAGATSEVDGTGETPLDLARAHAHADIVALLERAARRPRT